MEKNKMLGSFLTQHLGFSILYIFNYIFNSTFGFFNAGLFQPKFGSNMEKPKCWVVF